MKQMGIILVFVAVITACSSGKGVSSQETSQGKEASPQQVETQPVPDLPEGLRKLSEQYGMEFVYVPGGEFLMGSSEEQIDDALALCNSDTGRNCQREYFETDAPQHVVDLDAYWIMSTEVTNAQYAHCVADGICDPPSDPSKQDGVYVDHPVTGVNWYQVQTFASWIGGRLPTEAEWEKAARGVDGRLYPWGNTEPDCTKLNYTRWRGMQCVSDTSKVGSYPSGSSPYGALDMAGNVQEWVNDWYEDDYYSRSPGKNPTGPEMGRVRVLRGGGWRNDNLAVSCTSRSWWDPTKKYDDIGFRLVFSTE